MPNSTVQAAAEGLPIDRIELCDQLQNAVDIISCLVMAGEAVGDRRQKNAIVRVAWSALDIIEGVQRQLEYDNDGDAE
jgi:hypothetical protein